MVFYSPSADWGLSMGKHERIKDKPKPASSDEATTSPTAVSGMDVTPRMALAGVDMPKLETPAEAAKIDMPKVEAPTLDMPKLDAPAIEIRAIEMPKIETATAEPATIATPKIATPKIELASIAAPRIVPDIEE